MRAWYYLCNEKGNVVGDVCRRADPCALYHRILRLQFFYNYGSADSADAPAPQQELSVVEKASVVQQLNDERPEKPVLPPPPSGKTTVSPQQADPADPEAAAKIHILQGLNAE